MKTFGRKSLRLTEDPAGLPYKLSRSWDEQVVEGLDWT
jgi:hypothetical protein